MSFASRGARAAARSIKRPLQRQPRRYAHHEEHGHGESHGEGAHHVAGGSGKESFGTGFYVTMALIPLCYGVYTVASSPEDNAISRLVDQYKNKDEVAGQRVILHTKMMEQALADRHLFKGSARDVNGPELRFPEGLNAGSPWNVVAGQGTADMSLLMEHYAEKYKDMEDARLARMENGKVVTVYDHKHEDAPEVVRKIYRGTK